MTKFNLHNREIGKIAHKFLTAWRARVNYGPSNVSKFPVMLAVRRNGLQICYKPSEREVKHRFNLWFLYVPTYLVYGSIYKFGARYGKQMGFFFLISL